MAKYPDVSMSSSCQPLRSRDREGRSRWTDYHGPDSNEHLQNSTASHKGLNVHWVVQLNDVAEGLMAKMYSLNQILDYPDPATQVYSEAFWKSGVFPNHPRICMLLSKKFPDHFSKLQLERMDEAAFDALREDAELHLQSLEPWIQVWSSRHCQRAIRASLHYLLGLDPGGGSIHSVDSRHRIVHRSGPLDYSSSRKVKHFKYEEQRSQSTAQVCCFSTWSDIIQVDVYM